MPGPMINPTVPSNVPRLPPSSVPSNAGPSQNNGQVRIKQEPDYDSSSALQASNLPPNYAGNNIAAERAAQHLQQKFGSTAGPQINRLQQQSNLPNMHLPVGGSQQRSPIGGQYASPNSPQMTEQQRQNIAQYHRQYAQNQAPFRPQEATQQPSPQPTQTPQPQTQPSTPPVTDNARTDGADEWDDFVVRRRLASSEYHDADMTIRQQLERSSRSMEGGGLMLARSDRMKQPHIVKSKSDGRDGSPKEYAQFDGAAGDEAESKDSIKDELFDDDDDEDAINSDLDDPDENAIEEEQDEGRPNQIMLCTYDKVQRVKNKWKCTLKDGVLNTGGKE